MGKKNVALVRKNEQLSELDLTKSIFASSPILEGEDLDAYNELFKRVSDMVGPKDIVEAIWIRDYVRLTWEILRYRSYIDRLIKAQVPNVLEEVLEPIVNGEIEEREFDLQKIRVQVGLTPTPTQMVVQGWCRGKTDTINWIKSSLRKTGLTMADIEARAMVLALDEIRVINQLVAQSESSCVAVLHQIEDWRAGFAQRLRAATDVIDGEFKAVELGNGTRGE